MSERTKAAETFLAVQKAFKEAEAPDRLAQIIAEHQISSYGSWCIAKDCKFMATKVTDPKHRDFNRGWTTNSQAMRLNYGRHIANLFFGDAS